MITLCFLRSQLQTPLGSFFPVWKSSYANMADFTLAKHVGGVQRPFEPRWKKTHTKDAQIPAFEFAASKQGRWNRFISFCQLFLFVFFFFCLLTGTLGCASLNLKSQTSLKVIIITFFLILLEVTVVGVELTTATLNNETSPSALCRHQRWVLLAYGRRRQLRALRLGSCAARPGATMPRPNIFFFPTRPRRRGRVGGCVPGRCPLTRTGKFILWDD